MGKNISVVGNSKDIFQKATKSIGIFRSLNNKLRSIGDIGKKLCIGNVKLIRRTK